MKIQVILFMFLSLGIYAQTGVNTRNPHPSAQVHISSTDKGVLLPQYQLTNLSSAVTPVSNPVVGSLIFNTGGAFMKGYYYWDGSKWNRLIVNSEMDQILNLRISGTYTASNDQSKLLISGTTNNYINFGSSNGTNYINSLGVPNPTNEYITLPAGTYKVDISLDCISPNASDFNNIGNNSHVYNIVASIVDTNNNLLTDEKTVTSISGTSTSSVQGYYFSFVFKLTTQQQVRLNLKHGLGRSTTAGTRTNQRGLVVNFRRLFE